MIPNNNNNNMIPRTMHYLSWEDKEIKISIDNDGGYETNIFLRKAINFFLIPILNRLPQRLFVGSGKRAKTVHEHASTHKALEVIYSFDHKLRFDKGILDGFFAYFWLKTNNAKALRNRLRLVKKELEKAIKNKQAHLKNLAYLTDRVLVAEGKKQRFGTQFIFKNNKLVPKPIMDRKNVNKRRIKYGLNIIEERIKKINKEYST